MSRRSMTVILDGIEGIDNAHRARRLVMQSAAAALRIPPNAEVMIRQKGEGQYRIDGALPNACDIEAIKVALHWFWEGVQAADKEVDSGAKFWGGVDDD